MEVSANFAFLKQEFPHAAESASYAERHVYGDPRASCFHARHALERLVKRVYKVDKTLSPPKVQNLDSYLTEPAFRKLVPMSHSQRERIDALRRWVIEGRAQSASRAEASAAGGESTVAPLHIEPAAAGAGDPGPEW